MNLFRSGLIFSLLLVLNFACSKYESSLLNPNNNSPKIVVLSSDQSSLFENETTNLT